MASAASNLVNKVWNYCHLLRDDGVSYGDYVEQLTYLPFLKMDYERTRPPYRRKSTIPEHCNPASLIELDGLRPPRCSEFSPAPAPSPLDERPAVRCSGARSLTVN